jgi:hypothetical protein
MKFFVEKFKNDIFLVFDTNKNSLVGCVIDDIILYNSNRI